jgi:uncharacterized membrane protein YgcG
MRIVPSSISDGWASQMKVGGARPIVRATVQRQNMRRYEYDTAWAQGGEYNDRHRSGHFASMIFGDKSGLFELRNIRSCEWERSVGQDAATCTLVLLNSEIVPIGSPRDNPSSPDEFDKPGYFTFNRGDQTISANRWGYDEETGWNGRLVPDMTIKTYEGYGTDPDLHPSRDPNLVQTGLWLIDKVTYTSNGEITLEMRDMARILLDEAVFPPAVPFSEYPLTWIANHSENVAGRDVTGGHWADTLISRGSASSSNDRYVGTDFTNQPYVRYVGANGGVEGHQAVDAIRNHDGDDKDLFWRSTGQDHYRDFVWWQFDVDGHMPVAALRLTMQGGPYRVYASIYDGTKWIGTKKIPYKVDSDTDSPSGIDIDAKIPFVKSFIADRAWPFDVILPRVYNATRVRLTFTRLRQVRVGEHPFRAGLREFRVYTGGSVGALSFQEGNKLKVIGNYGDYTHIVKWVCAWAGWYWPPHSTGDDFIRTRSETDPSVPAYETVSFVNPDPVLPKGRVWGDFMKSGTQGEADLTVDLFDKKPLMDVINYVRDLLGFLFFIDETGGVVWRMPNLGMAGTPKLGNYLSPEDILDGDGNRHTGKRGRHGRTTNILTLDEETTLLSYQTVLNSQNIRDRIFVANAVGGIGVVIKGFNPYPVGMRRVAGWTDQHFNSKREAKVMADMISAEQMFSYRSGQAITPGNPQIQIDDQIRIFERVTNETFYHYVVGIKSSLDMEEGDWTYELTTHWLGESPSDAWVVKVDELSDATQRYLEAIGVSPQDAEDNDDLGQNQSPSGYPDSTVPGGSSTGNSSPGGGGGTSSPTTGSGGGTAGGGGGSGLLGQYTTGAFLYSSTKGAVDSAKTTAMRNFLNTSPEQQSSGRDWPALTGAQGNTWGMAYRESHASDPIWTFHATGLGDIPTAVRWLTTQGCHIPSGFEASITGTSDSPMVIIDREIGVTVWASKVSKGVGNTILVAGSAGAFFHGSNGLDGRRSESNDARNFRSRGAIPDAMLIRKDLLDEAVATSGTLGHVLHCFWAASDGSGNPLFPMVGSEARNGWGREGQRISIDDSVDLDARPGSAYAKAIARTLQVHGAYIGDNAGRIGTTFKLEQDRPGHVVWGTSIGVDELEGTVTWDDFVAHVTPS